MIRRASMSSRNSAVSRMARTTQSSPSRAARSSSGSSMSVTFCTYVTVCPASRHSRCTRSNAIMVAAWPRCVASYGVIPQTYMVAVDPGLVGWTDCRAESYNRGGVGRPGRVGTSCPVQASMVTSLSRPPDGKSHRRPGHGGPVVRRLGEPPRPDQPLHPQPYVLHLGDRQMFLERLAQRAVERLAEPGQGLQQLVRDRLAGPAPEHRAQLVLDVEGDSV